MLYHLINGQRHFSKTIKLIIYNYFFLNGYKNIFTFLRLSKRHIFIILLEILNTWYTETNLQSLFRFSGLPQGHRWIENWIVFLFVHWKFALSESIQVLTQYFNKRRKGPATLNTKFHCGYDHRSWLKLLATSLEFYLVKARTRLFPSIYKNDYDKNNIFPNTQCIWFLQSCPLSLVLSDCFMQLISLLINNQLTSEYTLHLSSSLQPLGTFIVC